MLTSKLSGLAMHVHLLSSFQDLPLKFSTWQVTVEIFQLLLQTTNGEGSLPWQFHLVRNFILPILILWLNALVFLGVNEAKLWGKLGIVHTGRAWHSCKLRSPATELHSSQGGLAHLVEMLARWISYKVNLSRERTFYHFWDVHSS